MRLVGGTSTPNRFQTARHVAVKSKFDESTLNRCLAAQSTSAFHWSQFHQ